MKTYVIFKNDGMIKGFTEEQKAINLMNELKSQIPKDNYGCEVGCYCYHIKELEIEE